jgi:NADH-quinone oxidoreductase subunit M
MEPWWAAVAVLGIVLGAAYLLWLYQRTMFGTLDKPENMNLRDLDWRERWTLIPIIAFCVWIGVYPKPFLEPLEVPVQKIVERIEGASRVEAVRAPALQAVQPSSSDR